MDNNQLKSQIEQVANLSLSSDDGGDKNRTGKIITCTYCAITFRTRADLRQHCQTEAHQNVIMSDEGRDWKWRPPPRGYTVDSYTLCESYMENSSCHYGNQCVEAHGNDELNEWKERFEYRKMRLQRACEKELFGKSYTEQLLEKWVNAPSPDKVMKEKIDSVEETCSNELVTTVSSKVSKREWTFVLKTKRMLKAVALLEDAHRNHFTIKQVFPAEPRPSKRGQSFSNKVVEAELLSDQEWIVPNVDERYAEAPSERSSLLEHRVKIVFSTDIYGTFRQSVVFDFGAEPVLVKHFCVDVIPVTDADKIQEIKKEMVVSASQRWDESNSQILPYATSLTPHQQAATHKHDEEREQELLQRYPCPRASTFTLTQSTITEKKLTKNNYRSRMHELLYVEEIARYDQVARYNLTTKLQIVSTYLLSPSGMATSTAKYSHAGELFGLLTLGKDVSEDTSAGRLILNNCASVYVSNAGSSASANDAEKRKVYEALIEDKGKTMIYLKLSAKCVLDLNLTANTEFSADIQFQLNRLTYCEWHHAIDKIADYRIIFPETFLEPSIPWTPKKQWSDSLDPKLNSKQKEAVLAITAISNVPLPPILLIGPFGTGKTYTLASSIKQLLLQPEARILICTHSNSAADLYIKDYLHPWVEEGNKEATPLRVYYHKRWVATVNSTVQKYCLIDLIGNVRVFRRPTKEDLMKYRIIVVTLNISMELASLDLPKGYFTHILLDEAAQAMECEAIMPLALAGDTTRIVLAGDHMQMSPELFSNFAKERRLHVSLLERLYDHYPVDFPCKILLCENYRAHEAIIKFTSELFYDQKLIASGKQPRHEKFYPLTFFTTRGEDVQDKNSTAFYNNSEVYEVIERVQDLKKQWPASWGKINDQSIGIMTPYADQVFRIRSELRKRKMGGISVERVLNVQGKQFRAIFLSTVRTRRTCPKNDANSTGQTEDMDYGFLSNSKLLNTAITRAQSLVAVVGDPVALCSIGRCRKVWERFIEICNQNKSLFGITWSLLRSQLDGVELKKTFVLNPLAPEFIPRAMQAETYLREQQIAMHQQQPPTYPHSNQSHVPLAHIGIPIQPMMNPAMRDTNRWLPNDTSQQLDARRWMANINESGQMQTSQTQQSQQQLQQQQQPPYPYTHMFYQNQQQQSHHQMSMRDLKMPGYGVNVSNQSMPPQPALNYTPNNQSNLWTPFNNNQNSWPKLNQHGIRPPPPQSQQQLNLNMPPILRQPPAMPASMRSPGSQHLHHNQLSYMQNNKQPPPYAGAAQLNAATASPANPLRPNALSTQLTQQQSQPNEMNISPLTSDIMNSITARANQVYQQNLYNMNSKNPRIMEQMPQPQPPQQQVTANYKNQYFMAQQQAPQQLVPPMNQHHLPAPSQQPQAPHLPLNQAPPKVPPMLQPQITPNVPDFSNLLPPNMSFYDMACEPKENQYKWFLKLGETQGSEAANKYAEILGQVPLPVSTATDLMTKQPPLSLNTPTMPNISANVDMMFENLVNGSTPILGDLLGKKDVPNDTAFPLLGAPLSNRNGNDHASVLTTTDLLNPRPNVIPSSLQPPQNAAGSSQPLYRRQAGASALGTSTATPHQWGHNKLTDTYSNAVTLNQLASQDADALLRTTATTTAAHSRNFDNARMSANMPMSIASTASDLMDNSLFENLFNHNGSLNPNSHNDQKVHSNQQPSHFDSSSNAVTLGSAHDKYHAAYANNQNMLMHDHQQSGNAFTRSSQKGFYGIATDELHRQNKSINSYSNAVSLSQLQPAHDKFHSNTTSQISYASVLTQGTNQQQQQQQNQNHLLGKPQQQQQQQFQAQQQSKSDEKDPFAAAIRELGRPSNGLYGLFGN